MIGLAVFPKLFSVVGKVISYKANITMDEYWKQYRNELSPADI
jgi:hypothetical protein